jgi:hypothetical protein
MHTLFLELIMRVVISSLLAVLSAGCPLNGGDPTDSGLSWFQAESVFPENFEDSYLRIDDCKTSSHGGMSVITWLNEIGQPTWESYRTALAGGDVLPDDERITFAPGTVIVKAQYSDANCLELGLFTAMKKLESGSAPDQHDWTWQKMTPTTFETGSPAGCVGCHEPWQQTDYVATVPGAD